MIDLKVFIYLIPSIILGSYGSLFLKKGASRFTFNLKKIKNNFTVFIGIFLFGSSAILYTLSLRFGELSVIYPLSSISYIVIALLSIKYLGEKMNKKRWIGIILIIIGSFLVAL